MKHCYMTIIHIAQTMHKDFLYCFIMKHILQAFSIEGKTSVFYTITIERDISLRRRPWTD